MSSGFSSHEVRRYSRHLLLPEFGVKAQKKLKAASVLCIGAGGLGCPAALYLAAAGIGRLGIVDFDSVDESNLQRQVLHRSADVGRPKVESARQHLQELNPFVDVQTHELRLSSENALEVFRGYDLVLDGSDAYATRYLINDAAVLSGVPCVSGSVYRFEGQVSVFGAKEGPCYRCAYPEPPPPGLVLACGEGGVLGALTGMVGTIQATEAIKVLTDVGEPLVGQLLMIDGLDMSFRKLRLRKDPSCALCGDAPSIHGLIDYAAFCGITTTHVPSITAQALFARLKAGEAPQLLDVREPLEREINGIRSAVGISLSELESRFAELALDHEIIVICKVGDRSATAVRQLTRLGASKVLHLEGGVEAWLDEVDDDAAFRY